MQFELKFNMDNAAFAEMPEAEVNKILVNTGDRVLQGDVYGNCVDSNGNTVGSWEITW